MEPELTATDGEVYALRGEWTALHIRALDRLTAGAPAGMRALDGRAIERMDTTGAWMVLRLARALGLKPDFFREAGAFRPEHAALLAEAAAPEEALAEPKQPNIIANVPRAYVRRVGALIHRGEEALEFTGEFLFKFGRSLLNPTRLRLRSIIAQSYAVGVAASPLIALISFLIAIVLSYQGSAQLARFGAEIYTVDLVAISVLREMGVLLTAIMVAGRSGSAFAAEIGVMKLNEEIDALQVTGLDPAEVLVLPRILALIIMLPLLTMLANLCGLTGAGVMAVLRTGLSPALFIERLQEAAKLTHFWAGMIKAPVFGLLVGLVGCYHGMRVSSSAESVGRETTASVVHAIFLVILADALFSIVFTQVGI